MQLRRHVAIEVADAHAATLRGLRDGEQVGVIHDRRSLAPPVQLPALQQGSVLS